MAENHWEAAKSSVSDMTGEWKRGFEMQGGRLCGESVMVVGYTEEDRVRREDCVNMISA